MSTSLISQSEIRVSLPPSIRQLLVAVRTRLRRDAALSGLLMLICCTTMVFWVTTGIDLGWFAIQRLELPVGLRAILLAVLLPSFLWMLIARVLHPLLRPIRDSDVALLIERRFPQFKDRLITAVESVTGYPADGPLVPGMLQRAVDEAETMVSAIAVQDLFDVRPLRRSGVQAALLLFSVLVFAVVQPGSLHRWWKAFVLCEAVYHQRTTDLHVYAVAQPGDRRVEFREADTDRFYLHPRGADLELQMVVPAGGPESGGDWVIPDRIRVDVIRRDGSVSRSYVSAAAGRIFRFVLTRLQEPVQVEILAGDYRSPWPWRIEPVNAPGLDAVKLDCRFPEYTGWNQQRETQISVTGSEVALPLGTQFELTALSAKTLQSARLVTDWFELSGDQETTRLVAREGFQIPEYKSGPLISADGRSLSVQFRIEPAVAVKPTSESAAEPSSELSQAAADDSGEGTQNAGGLPIASNTAIRFFLHDSDDVMSINPEVLRVRGIEDRPPVIVARGVGIDNAVTRLARIPIAGRITDDYGLVSAGFQFLVDDESNWRPRPFRRVLPTGAMDFELRRSDSELYEVFEVQPLELSEGQTLTLAVTAVDGNDLTVPGVTRSEPMVFRIVSNEDLLSLLYTREITLRRRLEEVISQLEQIRDDLQFHQEVARRVDSGNTAEIRPEDSVALITCASRSANSLRRQTNELKSIAEGFGEIVQQLINNAIPPQQLAQNMRDQILLPMLRVSEQPMLEADRALGEFAASGRSDQPKEPLVRSSEARVSAVIVPLKQILESVRDLAEFHEAIRDLKAILEDQQRLTDEIKAMQKRALIDKL